MSSVLVVGEGATVPDAGRRLPRPTLAMMAWVRNPRETDAVVGVIESVVYGWRHVQPRSLLLLTNADATESPGDVHAEVLDRVAVRRDELPNRHPVMLALDRIARMMPELAERAHDELIQLARNVAATPQETYVPRPLPTEIEKLLAPRPQDVPWDERLVAHVLRNL